MRLPWRNSRDHASEDALKQARKNLRAVQRRSGEVDKVTSGISGLGERNHFAEQLAEAIFRLKDGTA